MPTIIFTVTMLLSSVLYAQDGYHSREEVMCEVGQSCLISKKYNHVLKLIAVEDEYEQATGARLSSDSFLGDTVYSGADVCFKGEASEVCQVLELSAHAHGGDGIIHSFKCQAAAAIKLEYDIEYYGYGTESLKFEINRCD